MPATHEVSNQVPDLVGHDVAADPPLIEGLEREGAGWARDDLHAVGRLAGSAAAAEWADAAHRNEPSVTASPAPPGPTSARAPTSPAPRAS